jgi:cytochrome c biogenesis protein CcmG, thiol:disulfide interchange protein DsbE
MTRTRPRPLMIVAVLVVVGLSVLLVWGVVTKAPSTSIDAALAKGERPEAPALELPRLGQQTTATLDDFRGKVVVLNFWASWCGPCRDESPLLQRWHKRIEGRGGTVLGVDVEDVTSDAQAFIRKFGLTYPMLRDREASSARPFEVHGYPETLVLDRQGRIAAAFRGPVDDGFMRREVEPLLEERS